LRGVILAAGDGGRLRPLTLETPKILLEVAGHPLIHYPIAAMHDAGISDIAVVVGYMAEQARSVLLSDFPSVTIIMNEYYEGENASSILAARSFVADDSFVVAMGDHPIAADIVSSLLANESAGPLLCVDRLARFPTQTDDATRVMVDSEGYISAIGKGIEEWNAIDTGVFRMNLDVVEAVDHLVGRHGIGVGITDAVRFMGLYGPGFAACDVSGTLWGDVDTLDDYHFMDRLLRSVHGDDL